MLTADGPTSTPMLGSIIGAKIDRMPFSAWHVRLTAALGSGNFFDAVDATALTFILPVLVTLWKLSPLEVGLLISASYLGQLVGAIGAGMLAERIGRVTTLCLCLAMMSITSLACAASPNYLILFMIRVIQGIGLGGEVPIAATYMFEICPARFRGRAIIAVQFMFALGITFAAVIAMYLIPHFGWRSMFVLGALPILIALTLHFLVPESPRWLAAKGHSAKAEAAILAIEKAVYGAPHPEPVRLPAPLPRETEPAAGFGALLAPKLRYRTLSVWSVALCAAILSFAIIGWMPTIYRTVYHLPVQIALRYSALNGVLSLLGGFGTIFIIDRAPLKTSMLIGMWGAAGIVAFVAAAGTSLPTLLVAVCASGAFILVGLTQGAIYVYTPQIYPVQIRALGVGTATALFRVAAIIAPPATGLVLSRSGFRAVCIFWMLTALVGASAFIALALREAHINRRM